MIIGILVNLMQLPVNQGLVFREDLAQPLVVGFWEEPVWIGQQGFLYVEGFSNHEVIYKFGMEGLRFELILWVGDLLSNIHVLVFKPTLVDQDQEEQQAQQCALWASSWQWFTLSSHTLVPNHHTSL